MNAVAAALAPRQRFRGPVRLIQECVAAAFRIDVDEMVSDRRRLEIARPRQAAMYLAYTCCLKSMPTIGRCFNRDHTTVLHAIRAVEDRMCAVPGYREQIESLQAQVRAIVKDQPVEVPVCSRHEARELAYRISRMLADALERDPQLLIATLQRLAGRAQ